VRLDRSKADKLGQLTDRLEQATTLGAKIAVQFARATRNVQAGPAGNAFVMGHENPFQLGFIPTIPEADI
jgi:hypothetical protein